MQEQAMYYIIQSDNDNSKMRLRTRKEFYEFSKHPLPTTIEKVSTCHIIVVIIVITTRRRHNRIYALRTQASILKLVPRSIFTLPKFYKRR